MTNTIPNVPRELLCELRDAANEGMNATTRQHQIDHFAGLIAKADALLSDPSPAGVDGLNTDRNAAFKACPESGCDWGSFYLGWKARGEVEQAIIDGLRGENEALHAQVKVLQSDANSWQSGYDEGRRMGGKHCSLTIDQQARCLKFARTTMAVVANNANLRGVEYRSLVTEVKRIDAALAAVCAAAPNIAPTSEHSGS